MSEPTNYETIAACSAALLRGKALQACEVTAAAGMVIDWRTEQSGETVLVDGDAYEVAALFAALVGNEVALAAAAATAVSTWPPPKGTNDGNE